MEVQLKQQTLQQEQDLLFGGDERTYAARRFITAAERLYYASGKTLNRVEDTLAALEYRRLLCQYNLTRSELEFVQANYSAEEKELENDDYEEREELAAREKGKISGLKERLKKLDYEMWQVKESIQSSLAYEKWDQIIGAIQDHRGWQHLDHPDSLLGNRAYHPFGFIPARTGHEALNDPSTPKFAHARRVFCRQQSYGYEGQYLAFITSHPGLVDDNIELEEAYATRDRKIELFDLSPLVQRETDAVVDLRPAGTPVIALGTQNKSREGNSHSSGRRRPYSWVLDNDYYKAPLYYDLGDHDQVLTWFSHWRYMTAIAATPRKLGEARVLWETTYSAVDASSWDPKLDPENPSCFGWKRADWKLVEVKEQLRLRQYKYYDDLNHCSIVDPNGTEHVWHSEKTREQKDEEESSRRLLPVPRWAFEIVRYGVLQNRYDTNVRTLVPVSLKNTRGWRWHLWLKDVTQNFCDSFHSWTKEALQYICQGKDDSFSNLTWWNRPRLIDVWYGKDHKSLGRNVPWKHWFEPHLPLLKLREECGLFETADLATIQRTKAFNDSTDYAQKVQHYNEGHIRYHEADWPMPRLDADCDPEVIDARYDRQSTYEIQLASLSGTWAQLQEDSRKLLEEPEFVGFLKEPTKPAANTINSICNALASAAFAGAAGLGPTAPAKKKVEPNQETTSLKNYWKRQRVFAGLLPNPSKEGLLLMGLLFQRGPP